LLWVPGTAGAAVGVAGVAPTGAAGVALLLLKKFLMELTEFENDELTPLVNVLNERCPEGVLK
jgi:hypothetical protein